MRHRSNYLLGVVLVVGAFTACHGAETNAARERMRKIFEGVTRQGNVDQAICLWEYGSRNCPGGSDGFNRAASAIENALKVKGLNSFDEVKSFEIGEATYKRGDGGILKVSAVVGVKVTINGSEYEVECIDGEPVTWTK